MTTKAKETSVPFVSIPTDLDPEATLIVNLSGGKDSTALALWVTRESGLSNPIEFVFADTQHEHAWVYEYLDRLERVLGQVIHRIQGKESFIELMKRKQRFSSSMARFCTKELKVWPIRDWVAENFERYVIVLGIRAEESRYRAKLPAWQVGAHNGIPNPYEGPVWRPLIEWTEAEVFAIHERYGVPRNPLYDAGMSRVGCFPCILAKKSDLRAAFELDPDLLNHLRVMEREVGQAAKRGAASLFPPKKTPARFHDKRDAKSGKTYPSIDAVHRWATEPSPETRRRLEVVEDPPACAATYGLCE